MAGFVAWNIPDPPFRMHISDSSTANDVRSVYIGFTQLKSKGHPNSCAGILYTYTTSHTNTIDVCRSVQKYE